MSASGTVQAGARQAANPLASLLRRLFERISRPALWKKRRELRVCETLSLGNRNFVAVIGYQEQRFLVAGTPATISLLADVTQGAPEFDAASERDEASAE